MTIESTSTSLTQISSKQVAQTEPFQTAFPEFRTPVVSDYLTDALHWTVLFLDLLRRRGNEQDQRSQQRRAIAAVDYFVRPLTKYAGAYAAVMGGLDAFVFTAGIGENSASVRAALCEKLSWLGIALDPAANARNAERISTPESRVSVWVIPTE